MSDEQQSREPIVSEWAGYPNYECPILIETGSVDGWATFARCQFSTLDESAMRTHLDPKWGPHKVVADAAIVPVLDPLANDERAELETLRTRVDDLQRELTTTKGQLTKAKNQLEKTTPDAEGDE